MRKSRLSWHKQCKLIEHFVAGATVLRAVAKPIQSGNTLTCYQCDILRPDDKLIAVVSATVINLRGDKAKGR